LATAGAFITQRRRKGQAAKNYDSVQHVVPNPFGKGEAIIISKPMKTTNMTTSHLKNLVNRSSLQCGFLLITIALSCFALVSMVQAKPKPSPTPAGEDLGNGNTAAENVQALQSNTTGINNTATGWQSLFSNTEGANNTANGYQALYSNTQGVQNTANGSQALLSNTGGVNNTADGYQALYSNTIGSGNTAIGVSALQSNTAASNNTANGVLTLASTTTGFANTAVGYGALQQNTSGVLNIALGFKAGFDLTTGDFNIDIGDVGLPGDSNTIRVGGDWRITRTFIAGIRNATTENADAISVVIDSAGQLGTVSSSRRFKHEIRPMDHVSEAILALKPVTFHYKSDTKRTQQFGLIAEEVAEVNPDLVVRNESGQIYTVRYEAVNAMLLNEFLKEHRKVEAQEATIAQLKNGMKRLAAHLKEQDSKIEKVRAQFEARNPAPQMVLNNQ